MIEDMRHLEVFHTIENELQELIVDYNRRVSGQTDKIAIATLRLEQYDALAALMARHRRTLLFMANMPFDPETHFAEAVLVGVGGQ